MAADGGSGGWSCDRAQVKTVEDMQSKMESKYDILDEVSVRIELTTLGL